MSFYKIIQEQIENGQAVLVETEFPNSRKGKIEDCKRNIYGQKEILQKENHPLLKTLKQGKPIVETSNHIILKEPFFPKERLIVFGGGHIAIPLVTMGAMSGFRVTVVDDRPTFANRTRFPDAEQVICDNFEHSFIDLKIKPNDFIVIITRGHKYDETCLREILKRPETVYIGMIGSKRRVATVFQTLEKDGFEPERIQHVCSPIGLSIGAVTPEEISISILAEIIQRKRKDSNLSMFINRSDMETEMIAYLSEVKEPCAVITIMETHGSVPRNAGAKMIVYQSGRIQGSVGGGCSESQVMHQAIEIIGTRNWEMVTIDLTQDAAEEEGMVCGGTMTLLIEDYVD